MKKDKNYELEKEKAKLELENKVIVKANETKIGVYYFLLNNIEKTLVVNTLKNMRKIKELLKIINSKRLAYFYNIKTINNDKY